MAETNGPPAASEGAWFRWYLVLCALAVPLGAFQIEASGAGVTLSWEVTEKTPLLAVSLLLPGALWVLYRRGGRLRGAGLEIDVGEVRERLAQVRSDLQEVLSASPQGVPGATPEGLTRALRGVEAVLESLPRRR